MLSQPVRAFLFIAPCQETFPPDMKNPAQADARAGLFMRVIVSRNIPILLQTAAGGQRPHVKLPELLSLPTGYAPPPTSGVKPSAYYRYPNDCMFMNQIEDSEHQQSRGRLKRKRNPFQIFSYLKRISLFGGPYRDRTDDIHGVNVTLYQLS